MVSASWSSAPVIRKVKYSDEPDGYRWDRWQATAWACADSSVLMAPYSRGTADQSPATSIVSTITPVPNVRSGPMICAKVCTASLRCCHQCSP